MFVTFEGIEGSGKSTIINMLAQHIEKKGESPVITREPGGSELGCELRRILLDIRNRKLTPKAELCLFLAGRIQHLQDIIFPAIKASKIIFCDRYADSTIAYQGYGRGLDIAFIEQLNNFITNNFQPDLTFLLDVPVKVGLARAWERNRLQSDLSSEVRFDSEQAEFHERVRTGYIAIAQKNVNRIKIIDANRNLDEVFNDCLNILSKFCK